LAGVKKIFGFKVTVSAAKTGEKIADGTFLFCGYTIGREPTRGKNPAL
jgi:hypothetical protein